MRVLDTTVAVDHLRGFPAASSLLRELLSSAEPMAASEVVRFELLSGARSREEGGLEEFFESLAWVPVNEGISRLAGALARQYRPAYSGIDDADYLIAATALVLNADLLTTHVRHFPMFPGLSAPY